MSHNNIVFLFVLWIHRSGKQPDQTLSSFDLLQNVAAFIIGLLSYTLCLLNWVYLQTHTTPYTLIFLDKWIFKSFFVLYHFYGRLRTNSMQTKSPILACWPLTYLVGVIHRNKEDKQKKKTRKTNQNQTTIIPTQILVSEKIGSGTILFFKSYPWKCLYLRMFSSQLFCCPKKWHQYGFVWIM